MTQPARWLRGLAGCHLAPLTCAGLADWYLHRRTRIQPFSRKTSLR